MWLSFSRPEYLLLLPVALWLLWRLARASYADLRGRRRTARLGAARSLIVVCLVFALAGAQWVKRSRESDGGLRGGHVGERPAERAGARAATSSRSR